MSTAHSEEMFSKAFDANPALMAISTAADDKFVAVNQAFLAKLGFTRDEVLGRTSVELGVIEAARRADIVRKLRAKEPVHESDVAIRTKDGETLHVLFSAEFIRMENEDRLLSMMVDITERKRSEEERARLEAQMLNVQKLESLGVLAGSIAHDVNNFLMAIMGWTDLSLADVEPGTSLQRNIQRIAGVTHRAAELCRQLLAYSGRGRFVIAPVNLHDLIAEMTHMLHVSISKKAMLKVECANDLPIVSADATQLRQVMMNLVTNASDALGENTGTITISTGVRHLDQDYLQTALKSGEVREGRYIYIEVADTGCGFSQETQNRLFDPFFTTKVAGRGLGLAAVLGIVRGHRGAITVESTVGVGSVFRVFLPAFGADVTAVKAKPGTAAWHGTGVVLLVDDEDSVREVARAMLERLGFSVIPVSNGRDAIERFRERSAEVSCAVVDLTMPQMDGAETFRALRAIRDSLPVIIYSGYSESDVSARFGEEANLRFVQKPFDLTKLRDELRRLI